MTLTSVFLAKFNKTNELQLLCCYYM